MLITIFENGADLCLGQSERLRHVYHAVGLDDRFLVSSPIEMDHTAIRPDRPRSDGADALRSLHKWNFDVGVVEPGVRQNFDADVDALAVPAVVTIDLTVQEYGGRSRGLGDTGLV